MNEYPGMYNIEDDDQVLKDIVRRIRRIETQLFNLCLHLGIDPKTGNELRNRTNYGRNTYDD